MLLLSSVEFSFFGKDTIRSPVTMKEKFVYAIDDTHLNRSVRQALFALRTHTGRPLALLRNLNVYREKTTIFAIRSDVILNHLMRVIYIRLCTCCSFSI